MDTRGSYVHNSMVEYSAASKNFTLCNFLRNLWFQTKRFTGLLELKQLYKQTLLEKFLIFSKYQTIHWL